jgi:hypothetical protein
MLCGWTCCEFLKTQERVCFTSCSIRNLKTNDNSLKTTDRTMKYLLLLALFLGCVSAQGVRKAIIPGPYFLTLMPWQVLAIKDAVREAQSVYQYRLAYLAENATKLL